MSGVWRTVCVNERVRLRWPCPIYTDTEKVPCDIQEVRVSSAGSKEAGTSGPPLPVLYSADNNSPSAADTARGVPPRAGWHPKQQINSHFSPATRSFNSTSREMKSSVWWPSPRSAPNLCCKVTLNVSRPTSFFASPGSASLIHLNAVIPCQTVLSCLISEPQAVRGTCHPNPTSDYRVSQRWVLGEEVLSGNRAESRELSSMTSLPSDL